MLSAALNKFPLFDSHFHIIDNRFPLAANNGYLPDSFACQDYLQRMASYQLCGGAIVSGSFQLFDQGYLLAALKTLGPNFVGVTQLPATVSDTELIRLDKAGVRAVRFNLKRGGSEQLSHLSSFSARVYQLLGWHVELYVDAKELVDLYDTLVQLPAVSIDHLGLSRAGLPLLIRLLEQGVRVKATGFGRVDFAIEPALKDLYSANPDALMFGTDLPSTRAPVPYSDNDFHRLVDTLGEVAARAVLSQNAIAFYKPKRSA